MVPGQRVRETKLLTPTPILFHRCQEFSTSKSEMCKIVWNDFPQSFTPVWPMFGRWTVFQSFVLRKMKTLNGCLPLKRPGLTWNFAKHVSEYCQHFTVHSMCLHLKKSFSLFWFHLEIQICSRVVRSYKTTNLAEEFLAIYRSSYIYSELCQNYRNCVCTNLRL